ncbi:leishmanolysin-2 (M08 family) [Schistosoma mansoni]|uniref:leishmanolysin-2 (M08 family) n=1 Tax=Schistosoma mansoni TaxID=6183 RepID=UPI0001A6263F|nr:leishmanolysin-2 (M08 family) [Schistosoma mansoni]|eukprot:XP_018646415.1 leishmanolysin-2 (M08 family) [Schistosoma mansoni]
MNNEYKEIYSEGRGLAPNQLLIVVTDPCILSRYRSDVISGVIVQVHPSTGRPILGVINYCLKGKDLKEIGDRHLLEVIKHQIARILNDLMTRFLWESSRVSRITLAYFEDINMYEVDYSMADDFKWGKGLGCDFVLKSCYEYIKMRRSRRQDIQPYCDIPSEQKCASYENGIGTCALYKHKNQLNEVNQYMDDSFTFTDTQKEKYGGYSFFDYCPVLLVHSYEKDESSLCEWKSDLEPDSKLNSFLDYRGPDSACFMAKKIKYVNPLRLNPVENIPLCHKFRCPINSGVEVIFGGHAFPCPVDGGIIHIGDQLKNGIVSIDIQCPKCMSLCKVYRLDMFVSEPGSKPLSFSHREDLTSLYGKT